MNVHLTNYGQGTPLVFFHGWGFDSQIWLPLIPLLQKNYHIILVDLPGFGLTPMMDWDLFKQSLLAQLPECFSVIGWSMGGLYATRLTIDEPERVQSLLNITSSPRFIMDSAWPGVPKEVFLHFYKNLSSNIHQTLKDFIALQLHKNNVSFSLGHLPSAEGLESGLNILDTWDFREELKHIHQPVCFMFGRLDPITPIKTMNMMQTVYPNFKYVLFNRAAHMPFLSHTDLFIEEITGFFR